MIFDPVRPFLSAAFTVKFATEARERSEAAALRRQVFRAEQGLFDEDDRDGPDEVANPIAALSSDPLASDAFVGALRIAEAEPGTGWGSRLPVAAKHRRVGALGASLIGLAVSSASARDCTRFLAHVQSRTILLLQRLHWKTIGDLELQGRPYKEMQADLSFYPHFATPETGFLAMPRRAA